MIRLDSGVGQEEVVGGNQEAFLKQDGYAL